MSEASETVGTTTKDDDNKRSHDDEDNSDKKRKSPTDDNNNHGTYIWIFCFGSNGTKQLSQRVGSSYKSIWNRTYPAIAQGWLRGFKHTSKNWENCSVATIYQTHKEGTNDQVIGTVVKMTIEEVHALDPYEGFSETPRQNNKPNTYDRIPIKLKAYFKYKSSNNNSINRSSSSTESTTTTDECEDNNSWYDLEGENCQAYVMPEDKHNEFVDPCRRYKIACCKTIYTHHKLLSSMKGEPFPGCGVGSNDRANPKQELQREISLDINNAATKESKGTFHYILTHKDLNEI